MSEKKVLTTEEVKAKFAAEGKTFAQWCREHDYPYNYANRVLNKLVRGNFGMAHEIAVKLGMK